MDIFWKKKHNFTKKKKIRIELVKGPRLKFFPGVDYPRIWGSFQEGSQVYDVMIKNRLSGGVRFCFAFSPFFCLPELFSFISLPFFTFLKSSLSTKPTLNNHRSLTTTYMHKFIDYKTFHTVKISLDIYYTT